MRIVFAAIKLLLGDLVSVGQIQQLHLLRLRVHGQPQQSHRRVAPSVRVEPLGRVQILEKRLVCTPPEKRHVHNLKVRVVVSAVPAAVGLRKLLQKIVEAE